MSFLQVICANIFGMAISMVLLIWMIALFLRKLPHRNQGVTDIIIILAAILGEALLCSIFYKTGLYEQKKYNIIIILTEYVVLTAEMLILWKLYRESLRNSWIYAVLFSILQEFSEETLNFFTPNIFFRLEILEERIMYLVFQYIISPAVLTVTILVIRAVGGGKVLKQWLDGERLTMKSIVLVSLFPVIIDILQLFIENGEMLGGHNASLSLIFLPVIIAFFMYMGREEMHRQQLEAQKINLQQQNSYIEYLEEMQKEVRQFRHDYKNMMSGMALQARDGNMEAVQTFIQEVTEDFDSQVDGHIRRLTQLGNIHVLEVKGLFLTKLEAMKKENILCELEVLHSFSHTSMRSTDLCRCLGILLDNAIEEVQGKELSRIYIMLSSWEGCTTFRVKNKLYSSVDFEKIWEEGYSTKGTDRGIGLASYRKIIGNYENVSVHTSIQEGYFIQELKIQERNRREDVTGIYL